MRITASILGLFLVTPGMLLSQGTNLVQDSQFQIQLQEMDRQSAAPAKLRHSLDLLSRRSYSSLQVKAICGRLPSDAERLEFATAAFPRVVDPENFYEVYDAFTTFSKVLRLHDRVRGFPQGTPPPVYDNQPVSQQNLEAIIKALRGEPFENTRAGMAKQIFESSRKNFLSRQVLEIVRCYRFEENRLEVAKAGYGAVLDPENFFVVSEAFSFSDSREQLSQYIRDQNGRRTEMER